MLFQADVTDHEIQAILHYSGAMDTEPKTERRSCTPGDKCLALNCPFDRYPTRNSIKCIKMSEMRRAESGRNDTPPPFIANDSLEYFLNFAFPGEGIEKFIPGAVNGRKFMYPGVNSLFQKDGNLFIYLQLNVSDQP